MRLVSRENALPQADHGLRHVKLHISCTSGLRAPLAALGCRAYLGTATLTPVSCMVLLKSRGSPLQAKATATHTQHDGVSTSPVPLLQHAHIGVDMSPAHAHMGVGMGPAQQQPCFGWSLIPCGLLLAMPAAYEHCNNSLGVASSGPARQHLQSQWGPQHLQHPQHRSKECHVNTGLSALA